MKKILFLSSAFIMTTLGAYAADGIITGGAGTCTVDVLGVSDNNATANTIATWSLNDYECGAGQYLDEDTLTCTTCPAGSYCPGGTFTIENASSGTFDCPAGYTESAAGAGTNNECYTACTVANANIEHATAVSGNDYYGTTDADTCAATDCELGYHVEGNIEIVEKTPVLDIDVSPNAVVGFFVDGNGQTGITGADADFTDGSVTEKNTWATSLSQGILYGRASCQSVMHDAAYVYLLDNMQAVLEGNMTIAEFESGVSQVTDAAKAKYTTDLMSDLMAGNKNLFDFIDLQYVIYGINKEANYSTSDTGQYCYCQAIAYTPNGGEKSEITGVPWVHNSNLDWTSAEDCASGCAENCAAAFFDWPAYGGAIVGALEPAVTGGMCKITENNCPAGQYLAVVGDAMMCVPCKSGSYCPGGVYTIESENKGTNACPTTHPNSDAGAGADTQCYTACTLETANIAHATAVSGNDYYGTGTDTCSATACDTGYHVDGDIELVEQTPLIPVNYETAGTGSAAVEINGDPYNYEFPDSGLTENGTWATKYDYGVVYGRASCQPQIKDAGMAYIQTNMSALMSGGITVEEFLTGMLPLAGQAKTDFAAKVMQDVQSGKKSIEDMYKAIDVVFGSDYDADYQTTDTGQYCYCQMDGFSAITDGALGEKTSVTSAPWVFGYDGGSADDCVSYCAAECALNLLDDDVNDRAFRAAAFGALGYTEAGTCAANTINIDWNPDNGGAHTQNMCTYDDSITLPDEPVKVGYTFSGWKLVEPNSTPVQ